MQHESLCRVIIVGQPQPQLETCLTWNSAACSVGDLVFGQATGCLGTAMRGDGRTLVAAPPQLGTAAAAAVPTVYLTADACLRGAAGLKAGQTALIHAATG